MSRIRATDTGPELRLRRALWSRGRRYRIRSSLPGRPDLIFRGASLVVFVDGCFWHSCPEHGVVPESNRTYWADKLRRNQERDKEVSQTLSEMGWRVLRFWEHTIENDLDRVVRTIERELNRPRIEP